MKFSTLTLQHVPQVSFKLVKQVFRDQCTHLCSDTVIWHLVLIWKLGQLLFSPQICLLSLVTVSKNYFSNLSQSCRLIWQNISTYIRTTFHGAAKLCSSSYWKSRISAAFSELHPETYDSSPNKQMCPVWESFNMSLKNFHMLMLWIWSTGIICSIPWADVQVEDYMEGSRKDWKEDLLWKHIL